MLVGRWIVQYVAARVWSGVERVGAVLNLVMAIDQLFGEFYRYWCWFGVNVI